MSTFSNISSETAGPNEATFHMEPPWDVGTKVWPPWSYMIKSLKIFFSETKRPMTLKLGMPHRVLKYYQVYSNNDPELTLIYFTVRSNLVPYAFVWKKVKTLDFSETIVVYDLKLATDDRSD